MLSGTYFIAIIFAFVFWLTKALEEAIASVFSL